MWCNDDHEFRKGRQFVTKGMEHAVLDQVHGIRTEDDVKGKGWMFIQGTTENILKREWQELEASIRMTIISMRLVNGIT